MMGTLERVFHLSERNTNVKTEVIGGITTFMTMAYILAVNPSILSASGMDANAVLIATALAAFIGTLFMAIIANYPFALAPGLGLNAYFAYTVCGAMGYSWQIALLAVFIEGLIFIVLSLTNVREAIFNAIPTTLKKGVSVGIGLFVAFIGFQNAHIVVNSNSTLVTLVSFKNCIHQEGIAAILAIIGLIIIAVLSHYNVRGSILIGIIATWVLGMISQATGLYVVDFDKGFYSLYPSLSSFNLSSIASTFGACFTGDFSVVNPLDMVIIVFAFLFVDIFDTLGTVIGCAERAKMLDEDGKLPKIKEVLLADAVATTAGGILGTSTTTTFVESSAGIAEGARTGLASIVTGFLFLASLILAPIFIAIPGFATAPALIYVGFLMLAPIMDIKFDDLTEAIPAYVALLSMPLLYSISDGIAFGVVSYVIINMITKKLNKITPLMYILAILFVLKYIFL